jgi:sterol desaturase/sphingolipid hydroxylase (fatty acid hydroxylase superfamily)
MKHGSISLGQGYISGILSVVLGGCSLLAVLCYIFPEYLTTKELRTVYNGESLRPVLMYGMAFSMAFGVFTFTMNRKKRLGAAGVSMTLIAYALGGWSIPIGPVQDKGFAMGVDWLILAFLISAPIFIFLEKAFPLRKDQPVFREDWHTDTGYFIFNHLMITAFLLLSNQFASRYFTWIIESDLMGWVSEMPIWGQVLMLLFAADFVLYWTHRAFHESKYLWKFHAVHHSTEHLDWMSGSRGHLVHIITERCLVMVPLYAFGASKEALDIYVAIAAFQAVYIHSNLHFPLGKINNLFVDNRFHHWHHSSQKEAIDKNYCAHLPVWDLVFRTYYKPRESWPEKYGTTSPLPKGFFKQFTYPFKK